MEEENKVVPAEGVGQDAEHQAEINEQAVKADEKEEAASAQNTNRQVRSKSRTLQQK